MRANWVREALMTNAHSQFWQFYFRAEETKTGQTIHSLLPRQLVTLLQEYLTYWRPLLLSDNDPATLFLNSA
jgi:hypothetical protein